MDAPFEITFRHFEPTERIRERIDEQIAQLANFENGLVSGRVVIDAKNRQGQKKVVDILVELNYRGGVAVGRRTGEYPSPMGQRTFDAALTEAFQTAESQMKHHYRKLRPQDTKELSHQPAHGRIARLNAAVRNGFIEIQGGASLFFSEAVLEGDFDRLEVGDEVLATQAEAEGPYGPQARTVKPVAPLA